MEKKVRIHGDYSRQEDCKLENHKVWLLIEDESSIYANAAENRYYARAICLDCGLIGAYPLSIGERRRVVALPYGYDPYLCFEEVHQRYLELKRMYEPTTSEEYEAIVKTIKFEITGLHPPKHYDVAYEYEKRKPPYLASQEEIFFRMTLDLKRREEALRSDIKRRFFELKSLGLTDEDIFARIEHEHFISLQPEQPKDPSNLGLVRKK